MSAKILKPTKIKVFIIGIKPKTNQHMCRVGSYQTDRYFIDRKKVNPDLFVIELEICTCIYNIVNLLKSYDNIHSMTYITKIMLTGIAIRNTGYVL